MPVLYPYARQFIGRIVCVYGHRGINYCGVVTEVTREGILLEPLSARGPGFGRILIPFLMILAIAPLLIGGTGLGNPGYGYPGYGYPGNGYPGYGYPGSGYPAYGYPGYEPPITATQNEVPQETVPPDPAPQ